MSRISSNLTRTTTQLLSSRLLSSVQRTQAELAKATQQISTGRLFNRPSDAAGKVSAILLLRSRLAARDQESRSALAGGIVLDSTDASLGDIGDILLEAKTIAASQIGITSDEVTRRNQATVIDGQIQALLEMVNRQEHDVPLFGGNTAPGRGQPVFVARLGGVQYLGATTNLQGDYGLRSPLDFNSNGVDVFGALSTRVESKVDLDPQLTSDTLLSDLNGTAGRGIRQGTVKLTIDGVEALVDLTTAASAGDVVTRINQAIAAIDPAAGELAIDSGGYALTAAGGHVISIEDLETGETAADLGIAMSADGATAAGGEVDARLTERTLISALGVSVDLVGGLHITNGSETRVADFSGATTMRDLMNAVQTLDLGVRLQINADGTSFNLVSEVSGTALSVGENGGTTAADLGLGTYTNDTLLGDLRFGRGIEPQPGVDDFAITLHDGSTFNVDVDGDVTMGDLFDSIRDAAAAAGLTVGAPGDTGTSFNVGLAAVGTGIVFEDGTTGTEEFKVTQLGISLVATQLGIYKNAGVGNSIAGDDVAKVRTDSLFTHLIALRNALVENDSAGITLAGEGLERTIDQVAESRAEVGVKTRRIEQQQQRLEQLNLADQSTLSQLQDTDLAEVVSRLTQLQQQLQASLQAGANVLQQTLLDYLR